VRGRLFLDLRELKVLGHLVLKRSLLSAGGGAVVGEDYIVCRRVDRTAFLRNVQRIAECIVHFFLIEELVAEDDQLVIVD